MKFGVIGNNPLTMSLLLEIAGSDEHSLNVGAISDRLVQSFAAAQISMRLVSTPEDAMLDSAVDAVIIAVDDIEESLRLCRAATQAEKHVVIIPPLECSPAFSFELHLILDESRHCIVPLTGRFQLADLPVIEKCLQLARETISAVMRQTSRAHMHCLMVAQDIASCCVRKLDLIGDSNKVRIALSL